MRESNIGTPKANAKMRKKRNESNRKATKRQTPLHPVLDGGQRHHTTIFTLQ
jgi:hypothetical protein